MDFSSPSLHTQYKVHLKKKRPWSWFLILKWNHASSSFFFAHSNSCLDELLLQRGTTTHRPFFNKMPKKEILRNKAEKNKILFRYPFKTGRQAVWKEVAVTNLFSTDCPFCLGFFSSCYFIFPNATNFSVFNSLTKRNGEDEAQLEHNIMKLVVAYLKNCSS